MKEGRELLIYIHNNCLDTHAYELIRGPSQVLLKTTRMGFAKEGTLDSSIVDTGDGYVFTDHFLGRKIELNYSQAQAIKTLIELSDPDDVGGYKIFKEVGNEA